MSKLIGTVVGLFAVCVIALNVSAQGQEKGKGRGGQNVGKIASVDSEKKCFVLQGKAGSKTVMTTESTEFMKQKPGALADIKEKDSVLVVGEMSADQSSVEARVINVMPAQTSGKAKAKGKGSAGRGGVAGVVTATGENLAIRTRDDKNVSVKTNDRTRVLIPDKASFADLKEGLMVSVQGRPQGDNIEARRVTITPIGRPGKGG